MGRGVSVQTLLSDADERTLEPLVGARAFSLLKLLDPALVENARLQDVALQLHTAANLLREDHSRGLIINLLSVEKLRELATALGIAHPNDALKLLRGPGAVKKGSSLETKLFSFFGVIASDANGGEAEALPCETVVPKYALFDHQRRAADQIMERLCTTPRKVVLHMPTGAGKTRTAINVICDHLRSHSRTLVLWLAYSAELCEQAASEFATAWRHLGNRESHVYRFWGGLNIRLADLEDGFLVAGLSKIRAAASKDIDFLLRLADRTSLVIIDEAHQAVAPTYQSILETVFTKRPETGLLGLTATPGRSWADVSEDERLADFFARQKVTLTIEGYASPIEFLIEKGYLARPTFVRLYSDSKIELSPAELQELATDLEVPESVLQRLASDDQRNLKIIATAEDLMRRHRRILVFATTVDHAILLATVLRARGHDADAIVGTTNALDRERIIQKFRSNVERPIAICNYGVLTTGFDAPQTSAVAIARPTKSLVLYSQMVGRATRGPQAGGNPAAEIVTVVDPALPGFGSMSEAFQNWEDVW